MLQQNLFENEVSEKSPSYRGGSRASLIALQENVKRLLMSVTCGRSSGESLAKLHQDGFWEKMYQGYSQVTIDDSLEEYSMTWPHWGTLLGGQLTELLTLELTTEEKGSLLLPTPQASDGDAWLKMNKKDLQGCIYRYEMRGHAKRLIHYLAYQGHSLHQISEFYEMMMGFPKGWTELSVLETQ